MKDLELVLQTKLINIKVLLEDMMIVVEVKDMVILQTEKNQIMVVQQVVMEILGELMIFYLVHQIQIIIKFILEKMEHGKIQETQLLVLLVLVLHIQQHQISFISQLLQVMVLQLIQHLILEMVISELLLYHLKVLMHQVQESLNMMFLQDIQLFQRKD